VQSRVQVGQVGGMVVQGTSWVQSQAQVRQVDGMVAQSTSRAQVGQVGGIGQY
jgi:hypothetical protein